MNAQPTTNCAKWIRKVDYLSISKQQKNIGVSEMQGSGTGNPTTITPSLTSSSVHHSSHHRTVLFLSYYNVT